MDHTPKTEKQAWVPPKKAYRESIQLHFSVESQTLYNTEEIGEAIPVLVSKESGPVRHVLTDSRKRTPEVEQTSQRDVDEESIYSESQLTVGRLSTKRAPTSIAPDKTVETAVEQVVPARLRRRPVSEISPAVERPSVARQRMSVHVTDDLDELMRTASALKGDELEEGSSATRSSASNPASPSAPSATSIVESFATADQKSIETIGASIGHSKRSSRYSGSNYSDEMQVPERPKRLSIEKARRASQMQRESPEPPLALEKEKEETNEGDEAGSSQVAAAVSVGAAIAGAAAVGESAAAAGAAEAQTDAVGAAPIAPRAVSNRVVSHTDKELPHTPDQTNPIRESLLLARSERPQVRDSLHIESAQDHEEDYYDVDEPEVHPARAKSVKESTRNPRRKSTKKRSKRASSGALKPFSYNTLIHLLESINGTVIGEEFETLNLPVKEKQMIEKIVDLLSRLTLDMVLDENRYEIGLQRLEKAHRVLEGFL